MNDLESEIRKLNESVEELFLKIERMRKQIYIIYSIIASFVVIIIINFLIETKTVDLFFYFSICVIFIEISYILIKYATDENSLSNK